MRARRLVSVLFSITALVAVAVAARLLGREAAQQARAVTPVALSVASVTPHTQAVARQISASGTIWAWQEASIGAEANGLRLVALDVDTGDRVRRGQVLAAFESDAVAAELALSRAAVVEAEAACADATVDAARAAELRTTGALSDQQVRRYMTAEQTAVARLEAARAAAQVQRLRLAQTQVLAPDDGVISARVATLGAVASPGQELFRLIRRGRLEWRAEVAAVDLARIAPGQIARLTLAGGDTLTGKVRLVAPTIDAQTRNGLVYVDLPSVAAARAGMFARGAFDVGTAEALTLPHGAVLLRDGFSYVLRIDADSRVVRTKVTVGRPLGERVEIVGGIDASTRVVASGGAFLGDGDLVRVVDDPGADEGGAPARGSSARPSSGGRR